MSTPPSRPAWQTALDFEAQPEDHYLDNVNAPLLDFVEGSPREVLELGCAAGAFGARLKERWPQARVTGIEAGKAAAAKAATRLDRVIAARLEDIDLAAHGIEKGSLDTVFAADVLEHIPNPWKLLVDLRPFMAPGGALIASIPNVRNLSLVGDLIVNGNWSYVERGLLDVTHLRFFTLSSAHEMFAQTGWRVEKYNLNIAPGLADFWRQSQGRAETNVRAGKMTLENLTRAEIDELCTLQFFMRCRVAA